MLESIPDREYRSLDEVGEALAPVQPSSAADRRGAAARGERRAARRRRLRRSEPGAGRRARTNAPPWNPPQKALEKQTKTQKEQQQRQERGAAGLAALREPLALRDDRVARVARRLEARLEDRPAQRELAAEDERAARHRARRGCACPRNASSPAPAAVSAFDSAREPPGGALLVDLADEAEPALASASIRPSSPTTPPIASRRAGPASRRRQEQRRRRARRSPIALAPKSHGSSRRASCQTGIAVFASSVPV